ncbi:hypothetical protein IWX90DRAFT_4159 [Phyllosticta citrichinensis]|uniref:Uncharacterized protein n=1 Tax=Phyllosticta citrichinensis TaxID=1130410 RepID=A0ABR1Y519_9PEZI
MCGGWCIWLPPAPASSAKAPAPPRRLAGGPLCIGLPWPPRLWPGTAMKIARSGRGKAVRQSCQSRRPWASLGRAQSRAFGSFSLFLLSQPLSNAFGCAGKCFDRHDYRLTTADSTTSTLLCEGAGLERASTLARWQGRGGAVPRVRRRATPHTLPLIRHFNRMQMRSTKPGRRIEGSSGSAF